MYFWIFFLIIIFISLSLAYLSMREYKVGLFLIRNTQALNAKTLDLLHQLMRDSGQIVSLERLFKGGESALVIYGSKVMLKRLAPTLDLRELEDYVNETPKISAWEIKFENPELDKKSIFSKFPKLDREEQVWYQLLLEAQKGRQFNAQLRIVIETNDLKRRDYLVEVLAGSLGSLVKIHAVSFSNRNMVGPHHMKLTADIIAKIWSLP